MNDLVIVGAGGHCRSILSILRLQKKCSILAIYDNAPRPMST